ncbi:NTP transferase domain-containing protein [Verrucomicrobiaceae bacterium R5-34]|uniref:NTP transferase domain-containing protein n=1 Tax=Oceaniferula flava TaxID=2800421 RepID=A0AAE2V7L9_9BACT|nr:NTP transferase domain-containing protein [Oceaniferula flavus]MBK1831627.1 NTP transferase domain-containing protein [Verrucomicrobiaceae bacterium R5-34]MBK1854037.1 NTP transferase domain-containing protein [Oceaniferula flavus]MBM1135343.1 NTP transferase domain-containing protein [Oceaniferula flavus]
MKGLLLVGGKSSRMGEDKSEIVFRDGLTQRERGVQLLELVCDEVFISVAEGDGDGVIADAFGNVGPLGAIASAQKHDPKSAWFVLACDLPLLEKGHLQTLADAHTAECDATYFSSATDGLPEPLCAIWSPTTVSHVLESIQSGKRCPRSVLKNLNGQALPSPGLWPLANTNTEADAIEIRARLDGSTNEKTITLSYFAQLRELAGTDLESHRTHSVTPAGVFEEIRAKHSIPLKRKGMMVAVNGDFTDWSHQLTEGEELVFIPPVAGG